VTVLDRAENGPGPTALVAWTWKLYAVPLASPVTLRLVAPAGAGCRAPTGALVAASTTCTEYPVIGAPPSEAGGVQVTRAEAFP